MSGGGLQLGVLQLQPAVSKCFNFTSLLSKVGYFFEICIVKGTLIIDVHLHGSSRVTH